MSTQHPPTHEDAQWLAAWVETRDQTAFRALAEKNINIQVISTSEIKISVVIDEKYMELAVRVLHKAFGLDQQPERGVV